MGDDDVINLVSILGAYTMMFVSVGRSHIRLFSPARIESLAKFPNVRVSRYLVYLLFDMTCGERSSTQLQLTLRLTYYSARTRVWSPPKRNRLTLVMITIPR